MRRRAELHRAVAEATPDGERPSSGPLAARAATLRAVAAAAMRAGRLVKTAQAALALGGGFWRFPLPLGGANVYRVAPGQAPQVFASGFTNIIDLAFDQHRTLYVLEIFKNGLLSGDPTGALIRVVRNGVSTRSCRPV